MPPYVSIAEEGWVLFLLVLYFKKIKGLSDEGICSRSHQEKREGMLNIKRRAEHKSESKAMSLPHGPSVLVMMDLLKINNFF